MLPKNRPAQKELFLISFFAEIFQSEKESNSKSGKRTSKKIKILFSIFDVVDDFKKIVYFLTTILSEIKNFFLF